MKISVIIPVLNESGINDSIVHVRSLDPKADIEIIVVDGDSSGSTIKMIRDGRVSIAVSDPGRGVQMNTGAALAKGDVLLFLHADTELPTTAFDRIGTAMAGDTRVAGAFNLGIRTKRKIFRITERYVALRTRLTRVPFGDQAIFVRRAYFELIGGFRSIPIMEDVELMSRIRKRGDRICIIPEMVMTSARRWEKEGLFFSTFRNWMLQLFYIFGVAPERLAKYYR